MSGTVAHPPAVAARSEIYGFVTYLLSLLASLGLLAWAVLPHSVLHELGVFYYPDRYWALAIPIYSVFVVMMAYPVFWAVNLRSAPGLGDAACFVDEHSGFRSGEDRASADHAGRGELRDIPLPVVHRTLYASLPADFRVMYVSERRPLVD